MKLDEAKVRYGEIIDGKWANETQWMVILGVSPIFSSWINTASGKPTTKIYCNKDLVPALHKALQNVQDRNLVSQLSSFDGCFMIRDIRGIPGTPSVHSYGLALDICAKENPLGAEPQISPELVSCFKDAGFKWGGDFKRKDGMHFQLDTCEW